MRKQEFLARLRKGLSGLPQDDIEERVTFYGEMIDDRMEEGLSEETAVCQIGNVDEITSQIIADTPLAKIVKKKITPQKRLKTWEIVLLVLGSPIWLSLLIAGLAVVLSLYVVLWSAVISLWAAFGCVAGCALCGMAAGTGFAVGGNGLSGLAMIGAGIACAGFSIFLFFGCRGATKGVLLLAKKTAFGVKKCFVKEEVS